jgi:hypothetical protein
MKDFANLSPSNTLLKGHALRGLVSSCKFSTLTIDDRQQFFNPRLQCGIVGVDQFVVMHQLFLVRFFSLQTGRRLHHQILQISIFSQ